MKILIFSWRDIKNPKSGGAEILTHEIAKRWIKMGQEVFLVSAQFPQGKSQETIDGVKIFRPALFNRYSPFDYLSYLLKTRSFYQKNFKGKIDVAIDQVHGLPLFCKFYVKEKVIALPLEVAQKIWFYEISFPFNLVGFILEFLYLKYYRNLPFLTISSSTAKDLKGAGIKNVSIIPVGISVKPENKIPKKAPFPQIISLGRITKMKRIEHSLRAFKIVVEDFPEARLVIAGRDSKPYLEKLSNLTKKLKVEKKIKFLGFISEKEKIDLLKKSWVLISTSVHEGWGIVVIEAAACGTPAVTYKVPGLVDSIQDRKTGLLCQKNTPEELAKNINLLLSNHGLRLRLSNQALLYSRNFSWDKAAKETLELLQELMLK